MLKALSIKNVVLIDSLNIDFSSGLTVLTGETGAGKSILLDSLGLLLGSRTETSLIRYGEEKLSVTGVFELSKQNKIYEIAKTYDLDIDGDLIIKRTITKDGKNKIFLNDQAITLKLLKEISQNLIEIHGQRDSGGLLDSSTHINLLDNYGKYDNECEQTKKAFYDYKAALNELKTHEQNLAHAKEEEDTLKHWTQELERVSPKIGEEEELRSRRTELMNAEKIIEKLNSAYAYLQGTNSVLDCVSKASTAIARANEIVNGKYTDIEQNLETALYNLNDAIEQIEANSSDISLSQSEIDNIETRLFTLKDLAKKHQVTIDELPQKLEDMRQLLKTLNSSEEDIAILRQDTAKKREEYIKNAEKLHTIRVKTAENLDKNITKELPPLKMEKAKFKTKIETKSEKDWGEQGIDNICFEVSTNPNTPMGALDKIASGGELSRLMLALKVNLAEITSQETLIFDEIDTGIGGATAEAVGERLAKLAKKVQVMVVTHSPQVASFSTSHYKVEKKTENNITTTTITPLDNKGKTEEIARMLAGETITKEARAAAKVLLNKSPEPTLF